MGKTLYKAELERAWSEGFSSFEWPIFEDYVVRDGFLEPKGSIVRSYLPAAYPRLVADLAKVSPSDEKTLLGFARAWGDLGYTELGKRHTHADDPLPASGEAADPLRWIWTHIEAVRLCLQLIQYLQSKDMQGLANFLASFSDRPDLAPPNRRPSANMQASSTGAGLQWVLSVTFNYVDGHSVQTFTISSPQIDTLALGIIQKIVAPGIGGLFLYPEQALNADGRLSLVPRLRATALVEVFHWHLLRLLQGTNEVAKCADCGAYYVRTNDRQQYCPADPWASAGSESRCAKRLRMREMRKRAASGAPG